MLDGSIFQSMRMYKIDRCFNIGLKVSQIFDVAQYFGMSTSDILRMNVDLNSSALNSDKQLNQVHE